MELLCKPGAERLDKFWAPILEETLEGEMGDDEGLLFDLAR